MYSHQYHPCYFPMPIIRLRTNLRWMSAVGCTGNFRRFQKVVGNCSPKDICDNPIYERGCPLAVQVQVKIAQETGKVIPSIPRPGNSVTITSVRTIEVTKEMRYLFCLARKKRLDSRNWSQILKKYIK